MFREDEGIREPSSTPFGLDLIRLIESDKILVAYFVPPSRESWPCTRCILQHTLRASSLEFASHRVGYYRGALLWNDRRTLE